MSSFRFAALGASLLGLACCVAPTRARASDLELFTPETLSVSADLRAVGTDGEPPWEDGYVGKLRYGDEAGLRLGNADLVWQPRFGWVVSATLTASAHGGPRGEAGISEAFLTIRPKASGPVRISSRIGFVWLPLSLEHEGAEWRVADTITPSAINAWVGEELRPLALEASASFPISQARVTATAALFTMNDTAGTLLALRGWALHDRKTLIGRAQPLPELSEDLEYLQPRYTHPSIYLGKSALPRPGYYLKLALALPAPVRVELFHYDNRANPEDLNAELEWGWDTRFDQIALAASLGASTDLRAQAIRGRSRMGYADPAGRRWIESRFRSAFALLTRRIGKDAVAVRAEAFSTEQGGTLISSQDDEHGWAATLAAHRALGPQLSLWVEGLHVESTREARSREALAPRQRQNQLQLMLRASW